MNAETEVALDTLHQAILDHIAAAYPALATVSDYPEERRHLSLPACLVEMAEMDGVPDLDPGTGQLALMTRWEARLIIGWRTASAAREIRRLAGALGVTIHQQRWGLPVGPAEVLGMTPDAFEPQLDQFVVWRVDWQQVVHLGESVWSPASSLVPSEILYSTAPEIGPVHEEAYAPIDEAAP